MFKIRCRSGVFIMKTIYCSQDFMLLEHLLCMKNNTKASLYFNAFMYSTVFAKEY